MPTATDVPQVLTPREVADILRINRNEIYDKLKSGELDFPVRKVGVKWVIPARPFFAWLEGENLASASAGASDR